MTGGQGRPPVNHLTSPLSFKEFEVYSKCTPDSCSRCLNSNHSCKYYCQMKGLTSFGSFQVEPVPVRTAFEGKFKRCPVQKLLAVEQSGGDPKVPNCSFAAKALPTRPLLSYGSRYGVSWCGSGKWPGRPNLTCGQEVPQVIMQDNNALFPAHLDLKKKISCRVLFMCGFFQ